MRLPYPYRRTWRYDKTTDTLVEVVPEPMIMLPPSELSYSVNKYFKMLKEYW